MGVFIWHEWARFVSISASCYAMWSAYQAFIYRKVFWDFIGGHLRNPGGLQPSQAMIPLVKIVVKYPIVQSFAIAVSFIMLAIELPVPMVKGTSIHRSSAIRILLLMIQAVLTALYYQGTNAAIWSIIAAFGYLMGSMKGEERTEEKEHRGAVGVA